MAAGYSGTPLAKKLGIQPRSTVVLFGAPRGYVKLLQPIPDDVVFAEAVSRATDVAHLFVTDRKTLTSRLNSLRKKLRPDATLWVSWPKKASKVATDITEDTIREVAIPLGFVDVKVCAIDDIWSGLKLVVRKKLRT